MWPELQPELPSNRMQLWVTPTHTFYCRAITHPTQDVVWWVLMHIWSVVFHGIFTPVALCMSNIFLSLKNSNTLCCWSSLMGRSLISTRPGSPSWTAPNFPCPSSLWVWVRQTLRPWSFLMGTTEFSNLWPESRRSEISCSSCPSSSLPVYEPL